MQHKRKQPSHGAPPQAIVETHSASEAKCHTLLPRPPWLRAENQAFAAPHCEPSLSLRQDGEGRWCHHEAAPAVAGQVPAALLPPRAPEWERGRGEKEAVVGWTGHRRAKHPRLCSSPAQPSSGPSCRQPHLGQTAGTSQAGRPSSTSWCC